MPKTDITFIAFEPMLRPLPVTQGGGFRLTLDISEDQYENIKVLFNPIFKNDSLHVKIETENSSM